MPSPEGRRLLAQVYGTRLELLLEKVGIAAYERSELLAGAELDERARYRGEWPRICRAYDWAGSILCDWAHDLAYWRARRHRWDGEGTWILGRRDA